MKPTHVNIQMNLSSLKKSGLLILLLLIGVMNIKGQALGSWKNYLSYQSANMVAEDSKGYVYAIYDGSLIKYHLSSDENNSSWNPVSKIDGLNDVEIARIAYVEKSNTLFIVYINGNIDLLDINNGDVYNLASFMNNSNITDKTINNLEIFDKYAYISMNSGILYVDVERREIKETIGPKRKIYSVCLLGDYIYAASETGVIRAKKDSNLLQESNWKAYSLNGYVGDWSSINKLLNFKERLVFYQAGWGLYYQNEEGSNSFLFANSPSSSTQIVELHGQLVCLGNSGIYFYSDFEGQPEYYPISENLYGISSQNGSDYYWLAQGNSGIARFKKSTKTLSSSLTINSPKRNKTFDMRLSNGRLYVVSGYIYYVNENIPGEVMILEKDGSWYNTDADKVQEAIRKQTGFATLPCRDFLDVIVDPRDENHYFVASSGEGLYEFKNNEFVYLYNNMNTQTKSGENALESILPNNSDHYQYVRIHSLGYDKDNNLYMMNSQVAHPLSIYTKDGEWISVRNSAFKSMILIHGMIITKSNQIWVIAPLSGVNSGIFIMNNNGTVNDESDDVSVFLNSFVDQDGETVGITNFHCVVEDLNGTIWVGTNTGPIVFNNPTAMTMPNADNSRCSRIKVPLNDGTDEAYYLLDKVTIKTIAVDGGNRKWLGTNGSGVFLVSPTGDEVIANFTAENSPLLSNTINKIVVNNETGEVFIATDRGLISYTGLATEGKADYSNVYAYPNPVKPDFQGEVVVTGLVKDSYVKITDLSGNLIWQGNSVGGQFSWNCKNRSGERVKTGVYLVFAATADGSQGVVTKIVVVK